MPEADDRLDHLLERSSKPSAKPLVLICVVCVVVSVLGGFILLVFLDREFACNVLQFRCPPCAFSARGTCRVGEVCGRVTSERGLELGSGCFAPHDVIRCDPTANDSQDVCGTNMTCMQNGRCRFSTECQPSDPSARFPWRAPDFPPFFASGTQVAAFYQPDDPASIYKRTVALLLQGPEQPAKAIVNAGCMQSAAPGRDDGPSSTVWPPCADGDTPVFTGYNRIGGATYSLKAKPPLPTSTSYWPLSGTMADASDGITTLAPATFNMVFGSQWANPNERPYRYLMLQDSPPTLPQSEQSALSSATPPKIPSTVFAAYNVYRAPSAGHRGPTLINVPPSDLRDAQFERDPKTTAVRFVWNASTHLFSIQRYADDMTLQYSARRPTSGPWVVSFKSAPVATDFLQDFCWTTVDDTPAQGGSPITAAPFSRVVLAVPKRSALHGLTAAKCGRVDPTACHALTWSMLYPGADGRDLDAAGARAQSAPYTHDYSAAYAVPAIATQTVDESPRDSALWGTLGGDYRIAMGSAASSSGWQSLPDAVFAPAPALCRGASGTYGCPRTCNVSSSATKDNCARDMNWVSWCEWKDHPDLVRASGVA